MYLDLMGIDQWQLRGKKLAAEFSTYPLKTKASGGISGVLKLGSFPIAHEQSTLQLLDAMLAAVGLVRGEEEGLDYQFQIVMGEALAQDLLGFRKTLDEMRLRNLYSLPGEPELLVTYHPFDLLHSPGDKRKAWEDLKKIKL